MGQPATAVQQPSDLELVQGHLDTINRVGAGLAKLKADYGGLVFDVKTSQGMKDAMAARSKVREPRLEVERIRKEAKAPVLAIGRRIDSEAARITEAVLAIEAPIAAQIKTEEERVERERQEAIKAEQERIDRIRKRVTAIRGLPLLAVGKNAVQITALLRDLKGLAEDFDFAEFAAEAKDVTNTARDGLQQSLDARVAQDEENERLRIQREAQAEQQLKLNEQAAELRRQQDDLRKAQPPAATPEPPPLTPAEVEADAAPAAAHEPPATGTEILRRTGLPMAMSNRPTEEELIVAVATHFSVPRDTALAWLRDAQFMEVH